MFGEERLSTLFGSPSNNRIDSIFAELDRFCDGKDQKDDISMVEVLCKPIAI